MSINAQNTVPTYFLLYAVVMIFIVPRDTGTAAVLFWSGLVVTFVLLVQFAAFATATDDVGCGALLGFVVGGFVVWLLRDRGFAPAVVALLPWGGALCGPAMQIVGSAAIEVKRRFRRGTTGLAALSQAESQVKTSKTKMEHEVKHKRVAGLSALSGAEQKAKDSPKDAGV